MKSFFTILAGIDILFIHLRIISKALRRWLRQTGMVKRKVYAEL